MSRFYQSFTTRYNVYYNGSTHYDEQIKELENNYADDYTATLLLHPAEAYANPKAPQPATNFDRTIEKMQKAIQLHSIKKRPAKNSGKMKDPEYRKYLKRDEYNPFLHNAWVLMGKAQYMKGDYLAAAATFHYITRHFTWLPNLVTDAKLWEARCYCAEGWLNEADNLISRIKPEKLTSKSTRELYNLAYADYYVKNKQDSLAIPYLKYATGKASGGQKSRLNFLLGQLYARTGNREAAYTAFKKAGSGANNTYRTKFNARIKQSEVFTGKDIKGEVKSLKSMARFDRNKEYLDQVYYAIGNLYLSRKDTTHAIENYILAAKKSTRNGIEKAISQITLGTLYFEMHNYAEAQPCYAEAIPQLDENYPNYSLLKRRSDVLDELAVYAQNVKLQDSLVILSKLSPEEQTKVAQALVDALKKKEKEDAEAAQREEYLAQQKAQGNNMGNNNANKAPTTFNMASNDNSWYFYNTAAKNAGKTAFQKQWGNRKLEDNWRRRNKASFSMDEFEASTDADKENTESTDTVMSEEQKLSADALKKQEDPHFVEYYLKQIPKTPEEVVTCHDIIQEGRYNMGIILKDKLEDFASSINEFNTLLRVYPDNIYRLDIYYNMYLMYMRIEDIAMAEKYRQLILTDFADSKYGIAMQDANYLDNLRNMDRDQEAMYESAYTEYLANNNGAVHDAYAEMMRRYPLSKIMPKFMFINALSYVTEKNYDKFKETLKEMLQRYPETDITPVASSMLRQIAQGRKIEGGNSNVRGMIWSMRLSNDTTALSPDAKLTPFEDSKDKPQYYVLVYSTDSIAPNQLLFDIARHNFTSFVVKDFDLETMTFGQLGLLVIKGFANYNELIHYRRVLEADKELKIAPSVRPVMISEQNFNILLKEGRSFEEYFRFLEEASSEKVENKALDATDSNNVEEKDNNKK
ncbi:MAG: tetratricopeptide repeat protein [Muribaculaceae bacterium]|nr:tetratricopeptide repeat protein [Muribaculaceae bacterium]